MPEPAPAKVIPLWGPDDRDDAPAVSSPETAKHWLAHMRDQLAAMAANKAKPAAGPPGPTNHDHRRTDT